MGYNIKDVFYLSTSTDIAASTSNGGSAQLDLSAYIDPIARGRTKGTGLAIYKVHWIVSQAANGEPIDDAEAGSFRAGLLAGAGFGDLATGGLTATSAGFQATNSLLVSEYDWYGPKSMIANTNNTTATMMNPTLMPDTDVPYVVVRDNVCMVYEVGDHLTTKHTLSVRIECAQISLDQSTLNQLLRTQTV
jgi:hypothetical protein